MSEGTNDLQINPAVYGWGAKEQKETRRALTPFENPRYQAGAVEVKARCHPELRRRVTADTASPRYVPTG